MKYDLLTGATGLLGRYLLRDLSRAGRRLAVLARRGKLQSAAERIAAILGQWEACGAPALPRPVVLEGELSEPGLGLADAERQWVAANCQAVIHSAAAMAFRPDSRGEPWRTNVRGTAHLLEFCRAAGIRQFHHVSTAYLCGLRTGRILESELDVGQTLGNVYEDSKLQAEKLVRQAGFDVLTVFRPASILGDSQSGYTSNYHGFYLPLQLAYAFCNTIPPAQMNERFSARLGLTGDEGKNFVPVDWVAAVIAYLVTHAEHHGKTYHVASPRPVSVRLFQAVVQEAIERYSKRPLARAASETTLAQFERLFHDQMLIYRSHWRDDPTFDLTNTQAAARHLPCPAMDRALLLRVARYAVENNFSTPRHEPTPRAVERPAERSAGHSMQNANEARELQSPGLAATAPSAGDPSNVPPATSSRKELPAEIPVAIIGMACRLPGAENLDAYWKLVSEGRSAIRELPREMLDQSLYYDPRKGVRGKTYAKLAAILDDRRFDHARCPIPEELVRSADPCHLLMCGVAADALRHAGMDPFRVPTPNTSVYIGHAQGSSLAGDFTYATCIAEAAQFLREVDAFRALPAAEQEAVIAELVATVRGNLPHRTPDAPDTAASGIAGVISRAFHLSGPYLALNSACASSLQAILLAVRALQLGRVDMAIAGGASDCKSDTLVLFSHAQSMSSSGSRPFDADADGLIVSEGYVAVVLKTLPRALADGDPVHAVIRGLGVSSDGRGKSLWAPRKEGQIAAMRRAYRHGLEVGDLQYVEAHATATQLGDATELSAVSEVLCEHFAAGRKIPITSVKANIGHALEAAGMAGLIKLVLCMQHGQFVPGINIAHLNPKFDWDRAPVYVPRELTPWLAPADGRPRRGGVNAFGIGGLNMHVVVEELSPVLEAQYAPGGPLGLHPSPPLPPGEGRGEGGSSTNDSSSAIELRSSRRGLPADPLTPALSRRERETAQPTALVSPPDDAHAVAIVGMACILPGAPNLEAYWDLLQSGRDPKIAAPAERWRADLACRPGAHGPFASPTSRGGYITDFRYDWRAHKLPPKQIEQADPLQFMLLEAADQALQQAGLLDRPLERSRVGVMVGTEFGGDFAFQLQVALRLPEMERIVCKLLARRRMTPAQTRHITQHFADRLLAHWPALIDETGSFSTSSLASRISKTWDLMGGALTIDSGSTSSLAALSTCVDLLLAGDCDLMVCAAGQRRMGLPAYEALSLAGLLAPGSTVRAALDAQADGYVPGEGVAVVLLKRLADARRDGDPIRAILRSVSAARDADGRRALVLAAERALAAAGSTAQDLAAVELDGWAQPKPDAELVRGLQALQGPRRAIPLAVGSVLAQIGHLGGASGMATLLKAVLELDRGQVPATFALHAPLPTFAEAPGVLDPAAAPVTLRHATADGRRLAGVVSTGKDLTYHAVLEYGQKVAVPPQEEIPVPAQESESRHIEWRIVRLGAPDWDALAQQIAAAQRDLPERFAAADAVRFTPSDRVRLAVVVDRPAALGQKLQLAAGQLREAAGQAALEPRGIFVREIADRPPRVALVFPGQGSQYAGMLQALVEQVPAAARMHAEAEATMLRHGFPTFAQMAWEDNPGFGQDVWITQAAMLLADAIVLAALVDRGIRPDLVFGHSYGEYAALLAAGAWTFEEALLVTRARCEAIADSPTARGGMLATNASPGVLEKLTAALSEPVYLANHNAADQTVVAGRQPLLAELAAILEKHGYQSRVLAVPSPFHCPLMQGAASAFERSVRRATIVAPRVPLISVVDNEYAHDPQQIRRNLVTHLVSPVRYMDLVRRVAAERDTVLVEAGPQQALTRLHRRILESAAVATIAADNPKRPGLEPLLCVQALLEVTAALDARPADVAPSTSLSPREIPTVRKGEILEFDATARRRQKMRQTAAATPPAANGQPPAEATLKPAATPAPAAPARPAPVAVEPPKTVAPPAPVAAPPDLEKFLINFVVEQTGYPAEVVELDADLEADLGIDSIKKAQLFGELREYFDVTPSEDLTLDDFPTLRHVLNYLQTAPMRDGATIAATTTSVAGDAVADAEGDSPMFAGAKIGTVPGAASRPPVVSERQPPAAATPPRDDLERFLINFVVEQTGYPAEVVELDADLEADLGIDSIKKAQLFGELREYFDVTPSEDLTLDDFPTLRHVLNYLQTAPVKGATDVAQEATPDFFVQRSEAVAPRARR